MANETIALPGSGLVFNNTYDNIPAQYAAAYRNAVVAAENFFQSHFTNAATVNITFEWAPLSEGAAENDFAYIAVSYARLRAALSAHATTADDRAAVNALPASDPTRGAGFVVPITEAKVLGLVGANAPASVTVTLNSAFTGWQFGSDVVGALEHEISEGVMGRIGGLGDATQYSGGSLWGPMDLFRYSAPGLRSTVANGSPAYFSVDGVNLATSVQFHNQNDGTDLADWQGYTGDVFGAEKPGGPNFVSTTDLRVLDILGWTPSPTASASDDYANSLMDTAHPIGQVAVGGSSSGTLEVAGDRDWFQVQLTAGTQYVLTETGITLTDPYLRLHDASGATVAADDDATPGTNLNAQIVFTAPTTGTYYLEAGAHGDALTGQYSVSVQATGNTTGTNVAVSSPPAPSATPPITSATLASLPVYRFLDVADGGHFFTTSVSERDRVIAARPDMHYEGVGFHSDDPASGGATPVYRFLDRQDGGHFFTTNQTERDQVIATRPDMQFEGVGFYEHTSQQAGDTPVYRFLDTEDGGHFFTASAAERATVLASRPDLHYEGIAFYAPVG